MIRPTTILLLILCAVLFMNPNASMAKSPAPEGRTYFVVVIGLGDDPYVPEVDCLTFDATQACTLDDQTCLSWERAEGGLQTNKESGFSLTTTIDSDGLMINLEGQGRADSRGSKSSISAVARAAALDEQLNFSLAGRQTTRNQCLRRIDEYMAQNSSP